LLNQVQNNNNKTISMSHYIPARVLVKKIGEVHHLKDLYLILSLAHLSVHGMLQSLWVTPPARWEHIAEELVRFWKAQKSLTWVDISVG